MVDLQQIEHIDELATIVHRATAEMKDAPSVAFEEKDGKYWLTGAGIMISAEIAPGHIEFVRHGIKKNDIKYFHERTPMQYDGKNVTVRTMNNATAVYRSMIAILEAEKALQDSKSPKKFSETEAASNGYNRLDEMFS